MKFRLVLHIASDRTILPINYRYPISSWIYKSINRADSSFAQFLHEKGYAGTRQKKPFKFFTFSGLRIPSYERFDDRLFIKTDTVTLDISFLIEQAAEKFITGIFQFQRLGIGDNKSQVDFEVGRIEAQPIDIQEEMTLRTQSPVIVSSPEATDGRLKSRYLSPENEGYKKYFLQNLIRKYESYAHFTGNSISTDWHGNLDWELLPGRLKSRLETIKSGTSAQTKIRGYDYPFRVRAPLPLMRIGLLAGFGEKNSLGFGCVSERIND